MNLQEQHWNNLWYNYGTKEKAWHGIWTSYSPDKSILKSFQGIRKLWTNEDKTIIYHQNNYIYEDGSTTEKRWEMKKENSNLPDGLCHPASLSMRGLSYENGETAWVSKKYQEGQPFAAEIFFSYLNLRTSVAHVYGESGYLDRILHIRESLDTFPFETPIDTIETITGSWQGKQKIMTPDLKVYPDEDIKELALNSTTANYLTTFLPCKIICNAPKKINLGENFAMNVGKFITDHQFKRIRLYYNEKGELDRLVSEIFDRLY